MSVWNSEMKRSVSALQLTEVCWSVSSGRAARRETRLRGAPDDLVVHVREVAHVGDVVAAGAQRAQQRVEGYVHARVADVAVVVHGDAADVHAHAVALVWTRRENLLLPAQRVVQLQRRRV